MKRITIFFLLLGQFSFCNSELPFWSKTGHRVTGEVAEAHLSKKAKRAISKLLDGASLALVSTFADEIKADRSFSNFSPWHYVNFPADKKYTEVTPSDRGDLIVGIQKSIAIIKDESRTKEDRAFYLKMLVHFIGDLHQPMHVGRLEDKGGNDIQIQWFNNGTNLHRLWDRDLISSLEMSYTELASTLPVLSKKQRKALQAGHVLEWVEESQDIANELYLSVGVGENIGYQYSYKYKDLLRHQLQKGGLRLAKVLNDLFR